jgi:ribonuclease-3
MENKERHKQLKEFAGTIGIRFKNLSFLDTALTHSSFANELSGKSNENMEFLGDAILGMIVSFYLFKKYSYMNEGDLSRIKSVVVSRTILSWCSKKLNLGQYLRIGKGEEKTGGRTKQKNIANAFEALISAIYLDRGFPVCYDFIMGILEPEIERLVKDKNYHQDYKSLFQNFSQSKRRVMPEYRIIKEEGPQHKKKYQVSVFLNNKLYGIGIGPNKKIAEQKAAREAWETVSKENSKFQISDSKLKTKSENRKPRTENRKEGAQT